MYCEGTEVSEESGGRDDLCTDRSVLTTRQFFLLDYFGGNKKMIEEFLFIILGGGQPLYRETTIVRRWRKQKRRT